MRYRFLPALSLLLIAGCTTEVQTNPARTATEQLLISTAAERAAAQLSVQVPAGQSAFIDNGNFEGTDSKYAIAAIRSSLLQRGVKVSDNRKTADVIIETRAGALSTDRRTFLIGIPQFNVPIPFSSSPLSVPQLAIYGTEEQKGLAKFAVTGYDAKTGTLIGTAQEPQYGFSHHTHKTVMIFFAWTDSDALPPGIDSYSPDGHPRPKPQK